MLKRYIEDVDVELPELRLDMVELNLTDDKNTRAYFRLLDIFKGEKNTSGKIRHHNEMKEIVDNYKELDTKEKEKIFSLAEARKHLGRLKAARVASVVGEELAADPHQKIVVLAHHRDVIEDFEYHTDRPWRVKYVTIHGDTSLKVRHNLIEQFQTDPKTNLLIGQTQVVGLGLNLQAASEIILLEPDWSPDVNRQAIKRIHRIGSTKPCRARIFCYGDIDKAVMEKLQIKILMQDKLGV